MLKVLGRGSFATVFLARHRTSNKLYAIKAGKRENLELGNGRGARHFLREREVLEHLADCPLLVHLRYAFRDDRKVYLALEYCSGVSSSSTCGGRSAPRDKSSFMLLRSLLR